MIAQMAPMVLGRHEVDELYTASLTQGLRADVAVLGGAHADDVLPDDVYTRLAADLSGHGIPVVADLSGNQLKAALEGGLTVLKVSHEELIDDDWAPCDDPSALVDAMHELAKGARCVVVSRAADPALALVDGRVIEVVAPSLHQVDHRGAGDSMTAGIAVALARGQTFEQALRVGAAAGALNVTRRGLATGHEEAVTELVERVVLRETP
jgi:Fructose-1-phosphate kinase and related fructose-6-phosphate kinase (PfkB)